MRVSQFLQKDRFEFRFCSNESAEIRAWLEKLGITVSPGSNLNHAIIVFHSSTGVNLQFKIRDLKQEKSPMLSAMHASVIDDSDDENFDFWDKIPPFGVIEQYGFELINEQEASSEELESLFHVIELFMLDHFMMTTFKVSEIKPVERYMKQTISMSIPYLYDGIACYRYKNY
ncbi:hypothetical protein [Bacillus sp. FJAT-26390]|uniref:hypothetical protein n=1 Tax=Bacillus sp. FJAT-26390 TaxID=1743142 RepID=UPI000807B03A|nr:hypothetical protein [Bacillus sp. FJAT-26390]OBZ12225.1 hypothetical protein A7975_14370 [Bacillus sp. FJAT-26390]